MNGYFSVTLPTKKYIKACLVNQMGESPIMNSRSRFGGYFVDLLQRKTDKFDPVNARYNTSLKVYINKHLYYQRGGNLLNKDIKKFNQFVEEDIKCRLHFLLDYYNLFQPGFEPHIAKVREKLGIDIEAWSDDSMKKQWYRYRKEEKKPLIYLKQTVPEIQKFNPETMLFNPDPG